MLIQDVYSLVSDDLKKVEHEFHENLKSEVALLPQVGKYIIDSGGKRFRPLLLLLSAKFCQGKERKDFIKLACVIEFIHTATLLHDDVVDDAKIRRGTSSANNIWGNQASVLVGDFLFARSFISMVDIGNQRILKLIAGITIKMAEGETLQLTKGGDTSFTEEDYISVISNKTASLISVACQAGAILGGASSEKEEALSRYGLNLGLAFQIIDDMLDYTSTEKELGKTIGKDLMEGKLTLPLIYAIKKSSDSDGEKIAGIIEKDTIKEDDLLSIMKLIEKYKGIDYTREKARGFTGKAKDFLAGFNFSREKEALIGIADYVVERTS